LRNVRATENKSVRAALILYSPDTLDFIDTRHIGAALSMLTCQVSFSIDPSLWVDAQAFDRATV
jgi:hypothetical protein